MYKQEKRLIKVDDNTAIWRYMNFVSFYYMLLNSSLFFKRLDRYTDAYEGSLSKKTSDNLLAYRLGFPYTSQTEADDWTHASVAAITAYKMHTLSLSWTMDHHENYALWKIYLGENKEGIAIRTTVRKLINCFNSVEEPDIYCGKVSYTDLDIHNLNIFTVTTNKSPAYAFEKEYRALLFRQYDIPPGGTAKEAVPRFAEGASIRANLIPLFEEIYLSPFSPIWFKDVVHSTVDTLLPDFDKQKIIRSSLIDA